MLKASEAGVHMAEKEYYPDVTLAGTGSLKRSGDFEDMWSLTATFNIPLYYKSRQGQALASARAMSSAAIHDLAGIKAMLASSVRDNYSMVRSSDTLMDLYRTGLIPKTRQDFELSLSGYRTGQGRGDHGDEQAEGAARLRDRLLDAVRGAGEGDRPARGADGDRRPDSCTGRRRMNSRKRNSLRSQECGNRVDSSPRRR